MDNFEQLAETTSQEEVQTENALVVQPTTPLTVEQAGSYDNLYEEYRKGKAVEFPSWLVETSNGVEIISQELFIHIVDTQPILSVKLGNSKGICLFFYKNGRYVPLTDSDCIAFVKSFLPRRIRRSKDFLEVVRELKSEYANTDKSMLNSNENIVNFADRNLKHNNRSLVRT